MERPVLQVALDLSELKRALQIAREAVKGGADWIEAGTPLIKSEGMDAVRALKAEFPNFEIIADMKIADTGTMEVEMAAKAGASIITILADSDDSVIKEAVLAGRLYGVRIMGDLLNVKNPVERAIELEKLGIDIIIAHIGIDQQMTGKDSISLLSEISGKVAIPIGAAGGLNEGSASEAVACGADILLVGSAITKSADVTAAASSIREAMEKPSKRRVLKESLDEEIRKMFESVSSPNITDAMHRKGAMYDLISICGDVKMVGKAVTVETIAGDWAKPVEAIDVSEKGDVIVINNSHSVHVAPWGELATHSCVNKGIAGVVIDGSVRDVDDIMKIGMPVFSRGVSPNAGEPKGFGEIGVEIQCCGQQVKRGDWIIGDASGVVVVPGERAYEVAKRSVEVNRHENRIREEIKRGETLSSVVDLLRWEKR